MEQDKTTPKAINKSIHPRVVNGRTKHPMSNTAKPRNTKHDRNTRAYDRRQTDYNETLKRVPIQNRTAWTRPGSRNPKKVSG